MRSRVISQAKNVPKDVFRILLSRDAKILTPRLYLAELARL